MASIECTKGKRGTTCRIIVSGGYDENYKKIRHIKTWRVPEGWTEKRAKREVQRLAVAFEMQIKQGYLTDNRKTFSDYAEYAIELKERSGIKHNTILLYRYLLERLKPHIGHLKLVDIRPFHLNELYKKLSETGVRYTEKKVHSKVDIGKLLKEKSISREKLSRNAGVSHTTIT